MYHNLRCIAIVFLCVYTMWKLNETAQEPNISYTSCYNALGDRLIWFNLHEGNESANRKPIHWHRHNCDNRLLNLLYIPIYISTWIHTSTKTNQFSRVHGFSHRNLNADYIVNSVWHSWAGSHLFWVFLHISFHSVVSIIPIYPSVHSIFRNWPP